VKQWRIESGELTPDDYRVDNFRLFERHPDAGRIF